MPKPTRVADPQEPKPSTRRKPARAAGPAPANDRYRQEADQVARQVMRRSEAQEGEEESSHV